MANEDIKKFIKKETNPPVIIIKEYEYQKGKKWAIGTKVSVTQDKKKELIKGGYITNPEKVEENKEKLKSNK